MPGASPTSRYLARACSIRGRHGIVALPYRYLDHRLERCSARRWCDGLRWHCQQLLEVSTTFLLIAAGDPVLGERTWCCRVSRERNGGNSACTPGATTGTTAPGARGPLAGAHRDRAAWLLAAGPLRPVHGPRRTAPPARCGRRR